MTTNNTPAKAYTPEQLQTALDKCKIALMRAKEAVFFTVIAFSLKHKWDTSHSTAYVDGVHMGWNPDFFMGLPPEERIGVMVHEACHIAFDHIGLRKIHPAWCPDILNKAADHVINLMLLDRGFKLPSFRLADERFKGMNTEQVYKILEQEAANGKPQQTNPMADLVVGAQDDAAGQGKGNPGGMTDAQLQKHVRDMIIRASIQSKMAGEKPGTIPGDIQLMLDEILNPTLPWQTILRRYFTEYAKNDYSWKRPNRRFFPQHYLPSLHSIALMDLTFYVDISGSVADYQFQMFVNEIAGVLKMLKPKHVTIVQFDTAIHHVDKVSSLQELKNIEFHGRGGTHIECILKHMEDNKNQLSLVFTDGGFGWPRDTFKQRIIWLINDNPNWKPQFGDDIHFSTKDYEA